MPAARERVSKIANEADSTGSRRISGKVTVEELNKRRMLRSTNSNARAIERSLTLWSKPLEAAWRTK